MGKTSKIFTKAYDARDVFNTLEPKLLSEIHAAEY